ncbi:uncharacterized protein LOC106368770 [Brassica napus]|uniref:uncharacterized protein LOC106368770 n=1 Tax=Brassica napus TaxID=3708 RepID=UPI002078CDEE|nr:uncharacterized protein LOC106368770 [Brassica napus]
MYDRERQRCLLSHPAYPRHNLSLRVSHAIPLGCFTCGQNYTMFAEEYHCATCGVEFHDGCHQRPRRFTHPYHLQHPLTLFYRGPEHGTNFNPCGPNTFDQGRIAQPFADTVVSKSDIVFDKCTWCGKDFQGDWFYRCLICSFCLDLPCATTLPPLTIANPKGHHHSLLFLPRPLLVPCDACGLVNALEPSYACFQCNYMVHHKCIDLPRVIKITRHPQRLSFIPYRSPVISLCRICYKDVDVKYGQYSCKDCSYVAHPKCTTDKNVWDGRELEWEADESDENEEDIAPFKKLGDGIIDHFCHEHHLKHNGVGDTEKQCEACLFPIVSPQFYHCRECNYSLHEECAGLPRRLAHALHNHTLILDPSPGGSFSCSACFRASTGFRYTCSQEACRGVALDVRCISVQECFIHKSHEHQLFISTFYSNKGETLCNGCKKRCVTSHLQCAECEFALCYTCGTIPNEIHYRFDKHPLTISYGESADEDMYWCEVCEKQLDQREWYYTCNECCVTVHLGCVFGSSYTMKPGSMFQQIGGNVKVMRNSIRTRLFGSIYYEGYWWNSKWSYDDCRSEAVVFCSLICKEVGMRTPFI